MMTQVAKNRMNSMSREKVPEPTALVQYGTCSRIDTPVIASHHEVTHVTN